LSRLEIKGLIKMVGAASSPRRSRGNPDFPSWNSALLVLRGVDLKLGFIDSGECVGLGGATGSGKTTLLRLIAGLSVPDAGEILLDERVLSDGTKFVPPPERGIGMVFQNLGLWPHLSVEGHLEFVLSAAKLSRDERNTRKQEILETFLLRDLARRYPAELSGGEKHLLAIGRALCGNVRLLLLDEPFTGLDGALKQRVLDVLQRERTRRKLTTLLVTHNEDEMRVLCHRVVRLSEGRIVKPVSQRMNGAN